MRQQQLNYFYSVFATATATAFFTPPLRPPSHSAAARRPPLCASLCRIHFVVRCASCLLFVCLSVCLPVGLSALASICFGITTIPGSKKPSALPPYSFTPRLRIASAPALHVYDSSELADWIELDWMGWALGWLRFGVDCFTCDCIAGLSDCEWMSGQRDSGTFVSLTHSLAPGSCCCFMLLLLLSAFRINLTFKEKERAILAMRRSSNRNMHNNANLKFKCPRLGSIFKHCEMSGISGRSPHVTPNPKYP